MKKLVLLTLVLAMVLSMAGCGCKHEWNDATCTTPKTCSLCGETEGDVLEHTPGPMEVASVDTAALTITYQQVCTVCGAALDTQTGSTGIAPADGKMALSPEEWYACLSTNIQQLGASQTMMAYGVTENEDGAYIPSVVSMSGMLTAISFYDDQGAVVTTANQAQRNLTHNICVEAQFTNDTAKAFYMFLMVVAMTNNSQLDAESANTIAGAIMGGEEITDNGYTYAMSITSVENHTVRVDIVANA